MQVRERRRRSVGLAENRGFVFMVSHHRTIPRRNYSSPPLTIFGPD
jgi:hypothetical protein